MVEQGQSDLSGSQWRRRFRWTTLSRLLPILLLLPCVVALIVLGGITHHYAASLAAGSVLIQNLQTTLELNHQLHFGIEQQLNMLHRQFETPNPLFAYRFGQLNYELGEQQTQYLRLELDQRERLIVESIKTLQSELSVEAMQIFDRLRVGRRGEAAQGVERVENLGVQIDREFQALNHLQVLRLQEALGGLHQTVNIGYTAVWSLAALACGALSLFVVWLRWRVVKPLQSMVQASLRIRSGDSSARSQVHREDEIGAAARAFNSAADSLSESQRGLRQQTEALSQHLDDLRTQIVEKHRMAALGQLVSGAAHELNNPLTAIIGFAERQRLKAKAGRRDAEEIRTLEDILCQADRCRRILDNLMQFASPHPAEAQRFGVNGAVERALQLREYELKTRNTRLARDYDSSDPALNGDPRRLQQLVLHLLNEADEAIRSQGKPGLIRVRTVRTGDSVRVELSDNGPKIDDPARVFDFDLEQRRVTKGRGQGLGICRNIVAQEGGDIRAENWDDGVRFVVTLPLSEPRPSGTSRNNEGDAAKG